MMGYNFVFAGVESTPQDLPIKVGINLRKSILNNNYYYTIITL
jgi:hypothetical protein